MGAEGGLERILLVLLEDRIIEWILDKTLLALILFIRKLEILDTDLGWNPVTILLYFIKILFTNLFTTSVEIASILTSTMISSLDELFSKN